jgi:hypothetical protein
MSVSEKGMFAEMKNKGVKENGKGSNKICAKPHRKNACGKFKNGAVRIFDCKA